MKTSLFAIVGLVLGIGAGVSNALVEFSGSGADAQGVRPHTETTKGGQAGKTVAAQLEIVDGPEFDFGTMDQGETLTHAFVFKNTGDGPMTLRAGETTCGKCTVSSIEHGEVAPGEEVDVTLEWVARNYDAEFRQSATIYTNDPSQETVTLSVHGRVIHGVRVIPYDIAFSDIPVGQSRTAEAFLFGYREPEFQVTGHRWKDPDTAEFFAVEFSQLTAEEVAQERDAVAGVRAAVTLKGGLPIGLLRQDLLVETNLANHEPFEIPIRSKIVSSVTIVGTGFNEEINMLKMGNIKQSAGSSSALRIVIKGEHAADTSVTVGEIDPEGILQVELGDVRKFNEGAVLMYPFKVVIPPDTRPVNYIASKQNPAAKITFNTTHPEAPELTFRVSFSVIP